MLSIVLRFIYQSIKHKRVYDTSSKGENKEKYENK